jgi:hypothetical protein
MKFEIVGGGRTFDVSSQFKSETFASKTSVASVSASSFHNKFLKNGFFSYKSLLVVKMASILIFHLVF